MKEQSMQASKRLLFLSVALASLAGCSSMAEKLNSFKKKPEPEIIVEVTPPVRVESKLERTDRRLAVSWGNIGRAGAAELQPGYINVLTREGNITFDPSGGVNHSGGVNPSGEVADSGVIPKGTGSKPWNAASNTGKGYSMYQLSRWERYCNSGKGMDERDWRFVKSEGYDNAPLDALGGSCLRPTYRYEEYMTAWARFCTSSPQITGNDHRIVGSTSRPFSQVNPCQALLK